MKICLAVLIQYRLVLDQRQRTYTDGHAATVLYRASMGRRALKKLLERLRTLQLRNLTAVVLEAIFMRGSPFSADEKNWVVSPLYTTGGMGRAP